MIGNIATIVFCFAAGIIGYIAGKSVGYSQGLRDGMKTDFAVHQGITKGFKEFTEKLTSSPIAASGCYPQDHEDFNHNFLKEPHNARNKSKTNQ